MLEEELISKHMKTIVEVSLDLLSSTTILLLHGVSAVLMSLTTHLGKTWKVFYAVVGWTISLAQ